MFDWAHGIVRSNWISNWPLGMTALQTLGLIVWLCSILSVHIVDMIVEKVAHPNAA